MISPAPPRAQRRVHVARAVGEKRGPVGSVEPAGQDRGVEHEHRHDPLMGMYGVPQGGVVAQAQVAGERHDADAHPVLPARAGRGSRKSGGR
jgi:hypothetical protein